MKLPWLTTFTSLENFEKLQQQSLSQSGNEKAILRNGKNWLLKGRTLINFKHSTHLT